MVFKILHIVTLKDHSFKSLSFQLEVFVIFITNYISFVANFLYYSLQSADLPVTMKVSAIEEAVSSIRCHLKHILEQSFLILVYPFQTM